MIARGMKELDAKQAPDAKAAAERLGRPGAGRKPLSARDPSWSTRWSGWSTPSPEAIRWGRCCGPVAARPYAQRLTRARAARDMLALARLDARLLVGTDDHVVGVQSYPAPQFFWTDRAPARPSLRNAGHVGRSSCGTARDEWHPG